MTKGTESGKCRRQSTGVSQENFTFVVGRHRGRTGDDEGDTGESRGKRKRPERPGTHEESVRSLRGGLPDTYPGRDGPSRRGTCPGKFRDQVTVKEYFGRD